MFRVPVAIKILPGVVFFTLIATMVVLVSEKTNCKLGISNQLLTVLGTVLGLVMSFRTSSAYERYQDGRKLWMNIISVSRRLAQQIWLHIPVDRSKNDTCKNTTVLQNTIEKKSMINLILAFSISVKHLLRGEHGLLYEDLYPLISFLPEHADGDPTGQKLPLWQGIDEELPMVDVSRSSSHSDTEAHPPIIHPWPYPLKPARRMETRAFDFFPFLGFLKSTERDASSVHFKTRVLLEIIFALSDYTAWCMHNHLIESAIATAVTANLTALQDIISDLERIRNAPLPFAYQEHLRICLWLYLFFLPFQLYNGFKYITVPGTALVSFFLLGFPNPMKYDLNMLDHDRFCLEIQQELHLITAHAAFPDPTFLFGPRNQPFAPTDCRSAQELVLGERNGYRHNDAVQPGSASLRHVLLQNWRTVSIPGGE